MKLPNGFTLIEMIVVIGIVGVLAAGAVASYNTMNDKAKVEEAANTIAEGLLSIQKDATSGRGSNKCAASNEEFKGLRLSWNGANRQYSVSALCGTTPTAIAISGRTVPEKPLDAGLTTTATPPLEFYPLNKGALGATVVIKNDSVTKNIEINAAGGISVY